MKRAHTEIRRKEDTRGKKKKKAVTSPMVRDMTTEASPESLSGLLPAISTNSLGDAGLHPLRRKFEQVAQKGFKGVEIYYPELEDHAQKNTKNDIFKAAEEISEMCNDLNLTVVTIQPFTNFEGLADDYRLFTAQFLNQKLPEWVRLAYILRAEMILVPSNYFGLDEKRRPRTTSEYIVPDLQLLVDRGATLWQALREEDLEGSSEGKEKDKATSAPPTLKFAYEALAWGDHVDTWQKSWEVVKLVDRPNLGMCLDTFNIGARDYAEPSLFPPGIQIHGEERIWKSLNELSKIFKECAPEHRHKLFFVQVADGERMVEPLIGDIESPLTGEELLASDHHEPGQPSRMTWSRTSRLFPYEISARKAEGFLPITDMIRVIFHDLKYRGWVSFEIFNADLDDSSSQTTAVQARKGWECWWRMIQKLEAINLRLCDNSMSTT